MTKNPYRFIDACLIWALLLTVFPSAFAQEEQKKEAKAEFVLEEIVVTAERRETSAQDTPVAVSAWDAAQLDEQNIAGNQDLQIRMPSTFVNSNSVTIRGIGYRSVYLGVDKAVGIFNEGFYNDYSAYAFADLFDVARIESVRGPQSTLYGKSTMGGAINIIENKPTKQWSGQLKTSIGNYERRLFQAAFGGPLSFMDKLYYRVILSDIWFGGDQEAVFLGDDEYTNTRDRWRAAAKLLYEPTDNLSIYLRYDLTNTSERPGYNVLGDSWSQTRSTNPLIPSLNDDFISAYNFVSEGNYYRGPWYHLVQTYGDNPSLADPQKVAVSDGGHQSLNQEVVDLTVTLNLGDVTVKYLGLYRNWQYMSQNVDYDIGPNPDARKILTYPWTSHSWSSELQMMYGTEDSRLSAFAGLYYDDKTEDREWNLYFQGDWFWEFKFPYTYYYTGVTVTPHSDGWVYGPFSGLQDINEAIYAKVDYDIIDTLTISLGGRYTIDKKKGYEWLYYFLMYDWGFPPGYNINPLAAAAGYTHGQDLTEFGYPGRMGYIDDDGTVVDLVPGQYLRNGYPYELYNRQNSYGTNKGDWDQWLYHIGLDWRPKDGTLVYGKVDKGYRPGGYPIGAFQTEEFKAERLTSYEVGWKQLWMDGRFSTILDGFYYNYKDMQVSQTIGNNILIVNAGKAKNYGIELEATGYIVENLLGGLAYSWNIGEYDEFANAYDQYQPNKGLQDLSGNTEPYTPEHKITLNLTYTLPTNIGDFTFHGLGFWQSEIYTSQFNIPENIAPSYSRGDVDISWNSPSYKWRVTAWCKNLTDEDIMINQFHAGPTDYFTAVVTYASPRLFGIDVSFKW